MAENQAEKIERKIVAKNFCAGTAIPYTTKDFQGWHVMNNLQGIC